MTPPPHEAPAPGVRRFTVTSDHLALLSRMCVRWEPSHNGPGAPAVDAKRPYGFSVGVFGDVATILDPDGVAAAAQRDELDAYEAMHHESFMAVHRQTETVVAILLRNGSVQPGVYETTGPNQPWVYLGPNQMEDER